MFRPKGSLAREEQTADVVSAAVPQQKQERTQRTYTDDDDRGYASCGLERAKNAESKRPTLVLTGDANPEVGQEVVSP